MIKIPKENRIDQNERPQWDLIMKVLDDVVEAIMALKIVK
ncbi:hypothetical protein CLPUN_00530 [Clostridium puniceum]|uniref:Uncharacterized protein n=1 Tax=Clostridium puniceum TaxID=29367 RepID=A0A1S8TY77_9CLOT|nr:hypothetical protein CLPUN_00530 [Clostridium puniceum]